MARHHEELVKEEALKPHMGTAIGYTQRAIEILNNFKKS